MNRPKANIVKRSPLTIYKLGTAAILLLAAIVGLVAFLAFFDSDSRYFKASPIKIVLYVILALAVIFAVSAFFTFKKVEITKVSPRSSRIISLVPAATAAAVFAIVATEIAKGDKSTLSIIMTISILGVAFYHLSDVLKLSNDAKLALGYVKIIFCILLISKLHLDFYVELNSPLKLLTQFSSAAAILCTLSDLRVLIGRASTGYFIFSKICCLCITLLGAIGALTEVACNLDKYGADLLIYPILFLSAAIPTAVEFFTAAASPDGDDVLTPSEPDEKDPE